MTKKLLAAFALCLSLTSCAWFEKDVRPALSCAGKVIPLADITRVEQDLSPPPNYVDLAELCLTVGWDIGACIIDDAQARKPALKASASEFKRQHAVEIRSAQPVSLFAPATELNPPGSLSCPASVIPARGDDVQASKKERPSGSALRAPGGPAFSYAGENVGAQLASCYRECGDNTDALAPPGGCQCYRKVGSTWRWIASR